MLKQLYSSYTASNYLNIEKIVGISYFTLDKNTQICSKIDDFWEFIYVDKGEILICRNDEETILKQGDVLFLEPEIIYTICTSKLVPSNLFILSFTSKSSSMRMLKNLHLQLPPFFKRFITDMYCESGKTFDISSYNPEMRQLKPLDKCILGGTQMIKTYLQQFLIKVIRKSMNPKAFCISEENCKPIIFEIIKILEKNIYGELNITDLCATLGYGKTYACSEFKKSMGVSIMQYFTGLKITEAKRLIRQRNYNFTEISNMLMFSDSHYFTNVFKKNTGMTPKQYLYSIKND